MKTVANNKANKGMFFMCNGEKEKKQDQPGMTQPEGAWQPILVR